MRRCLADHASRLAGSGMPLVGAALAFVVVLGGSHRVAAQSAPEADPDGDFLSNAQELILGTAGTYADTDHDGFSDLEELARGTSPILASQSPSGTMPVHLGMTAHAGADGRIHVLVAVHTTLANPRQVQLGFGVQIDQRMVTFSNTWVASNSTSRITTGAGGQSLVQLLDVGFDTGPILAAGHLTFYATATVPGAGTILTADTVRLANVDGIVVLIMNPPRPDGAQQGMAPGQPGSIYVPLPTGGAGDIPATWSQGSVCFQRSTPVAVNGPVVTQEVVSAACIEGWDGYCPPTCAASVGSTYSTVDPIGLIGG